MGKYTIIGDLHVTHKSLDRTKDLFNLVEEIGLPCIWLGDMLDTKEVIRGKCLNSLFSYFEKSNLHHHVLVGNHDYFNLDCEAHSLEVLKALPNVTVVDQPLETDGMILIPYYHDASKLNSVLCDWVTNKIGTLIGHLEIYGFDFGNGRICTSGNSINQFGNFRRVISGHFHKYQSKDNLTYLGTPFSQSFGETNQVKYIAIYDSNTDEFKVAETEFPRHITYEFDCDNLNEMVEHWIFDVDIPNWEKNYYRVILKGSQANIDRFPKSMYEKLNVKWISRPSDHQVNDTAIDENSSNEAQFVKWAKEIKGMSDTTIELGLGILGSVK